MDNIIHFSKVISLFVIVAYVYFNLVPAIKQKLNKLTDIATDVSSN